MDFYLKIIRGIDMFNKSKKAISDELTQAKPLRLWPGVIIVILLSLFRFVTPIVAPEALK